MTSQTRVIENEKAMADFAARVAPHLKTGDVVTLTGGLGAGKTVFARALIQTLSPDIGEIPSPTFTLVQVYELPQISLWHFDLYRLKEKKLDILELGWEEARFSGAALVEWPDRLAGLLPKDRLEIKIDFVKDSENMRTVLLDPFGAWHDRLKGIKP